jgi:hypothetical protein
LCNIISINIYHKLVLTLLVAWLLERCYIYIGNEAFKSNQTHAIGNENASQNYCAYNENFHDLSYFWIYHKNRRLLVDRGSMAGRGFILSLWTIYVNSTNYLCYLRYVPAIKIALTCRGLLLSHIMTFHQLWCRYSMQPSKHPPIQWLRITACTAIVFVPKTRRHKGSGSRWASSQSAPR